MKTHFSERRLVENQAIFRAMNERVQKGFDRLNDIVEQDGSSDHYGIDKDTVLSFYCECSDASCLTRIDMTLREYADFHKDRKSFVIVNGHEIKEIEEVVAKKPDYNVVRKFKNPPEIEIEPQPMNDSLVDAG